MFRAFQWDKWRWLAVVCQQPVGTRQLEMYARAKRIFEADDDPAVNIAAKVYIGSFASRARLVCWICHFV